MIPNYVVWFPTCEKMYKIHLKDGPWMNNIMQYGPGPNIRNTYWVTFHRTYLSTKNITYIRPLLCAGDIKNEV